MEPRCAGLLALVTTMVLSLVLLLLLLPVGEGRASISVWPRGPGAFAYHGARRRSVSGRSLLLGWRSAAVLGPIREDEREVCVSGGALAAAVASRSNEYAAAPGASSVVCC